MSIDAEKQVEMLRKMYHIRAFEEMAEKLYGLGKTHGTMHLSIGMEASAVGTVAALRPDDFILSTHRGHGHCIAKGADLNLMMAEFFGKETGYCCGRGGSMHIADINGGNLGANGVVGGGLPLSVGVGLSIKMQKLDKVIVCFFGEGAANNGAFHESLNMAAIWELPVIFVCENNQYAMSFSFEKAFAIEKISDRAAGYGMSGVTVDGNDLMAVYHAVEQAATQARLGGGPTLVENLTYRWRGHSRSDVNRYRTKDEIESWKGKCPIKRYRQTLIEERQLTEEEADQIEVDAYQVVDASVEFAEASPDPDLSTIEEGVYA